MKRSILVLATAIATIVSVGIGDATADGGGACVGGKGCFATIQAALDAAHDGDVVRIGRGTFAGGITITKSVTLSGSGADDTVLSGGGPVVAIGGDGSTPTVRIRGVTITGGFTRSATHCGPTCGTNYVTATALGGGVRIAEGATATIEDSSITGNRVAPTTTVPSVRAKCPDGPCRFATAAGGGIEVAGALTLEDSNVTNNASEGVVSDAYGGGIVVEAGASLSMRDSTVSGNRATATPPFGRFAEGAGIFAARDSTLDLEDSAVTNNVATLTTTFPDGVDMNAHGGGIHHGDGGSVSIRDSRIDNNTASATDLNGQPAAFDAGVCICGDSPLELTESSVSGNHVLADVRSTEDAGPSGGALEFDGPATVRESRIVGNTTVVHSPAGVAGAIGAVGAFSQGPDPAAMSDTLVAGNTATATSESGTATVQGVGITANGLLALDRVAVMGNSGRADAPSGFAQGGGIWNDVLFFDPPVTLSLTRSVVTRNSLSASPGITVQGGGLFTGFPVTLDRSVIGGNSPDQCFGC